MNAVTGAVTAVTCGRDVTGIVPAVSLAQSPGRPPGSCPARHTGVACARLRDRSCDRSAQHASLRSLESIPVSLSVASLVTCLARPRGRIFVPKCPKAETAPLPGKGYLPRRHRRQDRALAAARRLVIKSTDRLHGASPLRARHGESAARRLHGSSARCLGETSARRNGHVARRLDCRSSRLPLGETAAWRLHGESECQVSRAVAARQDGRTAAGLHKHSAALAHGRPSPAQGFDWCSARVFSMFRSNSARKAAAFLASFGGARLPDTTIAGTAAVVTPRTVASVPLKSLRRLFGCFEIGLRPRSCRTCKKIQSAV